MLFGITFVFVYLSKPYLCLSIYLQKKQEKMYAHFACAKNNIKLLQASTICMADL
uniref:Uncharacterized protein n=1 Tax=Rhizophora mucronata TaxID=61149 RepID=A0A2P2QP42_RHIMU